MTKIEFTKEINNNILFNLPPEIYHELLTLAQAVVVKYGKLITLDVKEVLHEGLIKLYKKKDLRFKSRHHYFSLMDKILRGVVIDFLRKKKAIKNGGKFEKININSQNQCIHNNTSFGYIVIENAIKKLENHDKELAQIIRLKFLSSMSNNEIAKIMGKSENNINLKYRFARAFIKNELNETRI